MQSAHTTTMGTWVAIGIALGAGIGTIMNNVALGVSIGAGLGVLLGGFATRQRPKGSGDDVESDVGSTARETD